MDINVIVLVVAGSIGGLISTLKRHNGMLIWPIINIKTRQFRLGFPASILIGAFFAFVVDFVVISTLPDIVPDNVYNAFLLGLVAGATSLYSLNEILDHYLGITISDPDVMTFGSSLAPKGENNIHKLRMYTALEHVDGVARASINAGENAGVLRVIIVPKPGYDMNKVKMAAESIINMYKCPGIQVYVYLPEEVKVNMGFTIEVLDGRDPEETKAHYSSMVSDLVKDYINSLPPGENVLVSQIIGEVTRSDDLLRDLITDSIKTDPPFIQGRIIIGKYQVARAGDVLVQVLVRQHGV